MPAVSDPGAEITAAVAAAGFPVEVLPGPSAVTAALAAAGMPADSFLFLGFLPRRRRERQAALAQAAALPYTLVIFEAPHRLRPALADLQAILGDRQIAVCRELTKIHQEVWRGDLAGALDYFTAPRGEFALVVAGNTAADIGTAAADPDTARQQLAEKRQAGLRAREAVAAVTAATGLPRREVYQLWLELKAGGDSNMD